MPVRSSTSSVLRWPDREAVHEALTGWAREAARRDEVTRVGYFGSYARGDWGVGSDLDVVLLLRRSARPFLQRAAAFDTTRLPVPVDLLVYTEAEWEDVGLQFARRSGGTVTWVYARGAGGDAREEIPDGQAEIAPADTGTAQR